MVRTRFAPSPTGSLHLGAARTAVVNWLFARSQDGELILRIDDTDVERSDEGLVDEILGDLEWPEIDWDKGPVFQSKSLNNYADAYTALEGSETAYEKDGALWFRIPEGQLEFEDLIRGRIEIPAGAAKDFVIRRSDGTSTYNFATAVDDIALEVTHVLRGEDHISNTHLQILVIEALGKSPPAYGHLPLMLGPDGSKLSKRHGAAAIDEYRDDGYLPEALFNYLGIVTASFGEKEIASPRDLVDAFSLDRVHRSAAKFDLEKLRWMNGQHIRKLGLSDFENKLRPFLDHDPSKAELEALQSAGATLTECAKISRLFKEEYEFDDAAEVALAADGANNALSSLAASLPDSEMDAGSAKVLLGEVRGKLKEEGIAPKVTMKAIRAALTGCTSGPELHYFIAALDPEVIRRRLTKRST